MTHLLAVWGTSFKDALTDIITLFITFDYVLICMIGLTFWIYFISAYFSSFNLDGICGGINIHKIYRLKDSS